MKLVLRTIDGCATIPGGRALLLCDGDGVILPQQTSCVIEQEECGSTIITASFRVDGVDVLIDGSLVEEDD